MSTPNVDANADQGKTAAQLWAEELAAAKSAPDDKSVVQPTDPAPASAPTPPESATNPESNAPAPQAPAANTPADDPMAHLHPAVRARLEKTDSLEARLRKVESHTGNLNSTVKQQQEYITRLEGELKSARQSTVAAGNAAPTQQAVQNAQKSSEKWEALKAEFPEWAEAVEERLGVAVPTAPQINADELREQIRKEVLDELKKGELNTAGLQSAQQPAAQVENVVDEATEHRVVEAAHPGWRDMIATQQFADWYQKQPAEVRKLGDSPVADDAIALLTSYKDFAKAQPNADELKQRRQQQLKEAATMTRGTANLPAHKSIDDMSPKELWEYEAQLLEAQKKQRR